MASVNNPYAVRAGYPGGVGPAHRWDGAFVDAVAFDAGVQFPSLSDRGTALAQAIRKGQTHEIPEVGDIVFYAFEDLHVGIVTDISRFETDGSFRAVEAMVASGLPKASNTPDGIFERTRWARFDVATFASPEYQISPSRLQGFLTDVKSFFADTWHVIFPAPLLTDIAAQELVEDVISVSPSHFVNRKHPRHAFSVRLVQEALSIPVTGQWDNQTRAAYANWQRVCGYYGPDATGLPDTSTLRRLAEQSGKFGA